MKEEKLKITSKEELEKALDFIILDNWLDWPERDPNVSDVEYMKQIKENDRKLRMKILQADYDICIEDEEQ